MVLALAAPARAGLLLEERYQIHDRLYQIFFNEAGTVGVYPVLFVERGLGLNAGGRLIWRNVLGQGERVSLRGSWGGRFTQLYTADFRTGYRFGKLELGASALYSRRDRDYFYGIGNAEAIEPPAMTLPVQPGGPLVETRFRQHLFVGAGRADLMLSRYWRALGILAVDRRTFYDDGLGSVDEPVITDVFDPATIPGFESGATLGTAELELRYDSRRPGSPLHQPVINSTGVLAAISGGYSVGLDGEGWRFARYGADLQVFMGFPPDRRIIILRALLDGVYGDYENIPFTALPALGGGLLLRGYDPRRFRDRVALLGTFEYQWALAGGVYAFTFVDVGRVQPALDEVTFGQVRMGFGGGLHAYRSNISLGRLQISSSIDGGFFVRLIFDNLFDPRARRGPW